MKKKTVFTILMGMVLFFVVGIKSCAVETISMYYPTPGSAEPISLTGQYMEVASDPGQWKLFCNWLGAPATIVNIGATANGRSTLATPEYMTATSSSNTDTINAEVAYAMYIGLLPGNPDTATELQKVIWDATYDRSWGSGAILNGDSVFLYDGSTYGATSERVLMFQKVYNQIFQQTLCVGKDLLVVNSDKSALYVNQVEGEYIYGPFIININANIDQNGEAANALKSEIEGNYQYSGLYGSYDKNTAYVTNIEEIYSQLKSNFRQYASDVNSISLVAADGSEILGTNNKKFPAFGTSFFIKFKPANDGAIINIGSETGVKLFDIKAYYAGEVSYIEYVSTGNFQTEDMFVELQQDEILLTGDGISEELQEGVTCNFEAQNQVALDGATSGSNNTGSGASTVWGGIIKDYKWKTREDVLGAGTWTYEWSYDFCTTLRDAGHTSWEALKSEKRTESQRYDKLEINEPSMAEVILNGFCEVAAKTLFKCINYVTGNATPIESWMRGNVVLEQTYEFEKTVGQIMMCEERSYTYTYEDADGNTTSDTETYYSFYWDDIEITDENIALNQYNYEQAELPSSYSSGGNFDSTGYTLISSSGPSYSDYAVEASTIYNPTTTYKPSGKWKCSRDFKDLRGASKTTVTVPKMDREYYIEKVLGYNITTQGNLVAKADAQYNQIVNQQKEVVKSRVQTYVKITDWKFGSNYKQATTTVYIPSLKIAEALGGNVWNEGGSAKENTFDGKYTEREKVYPGMQVELYELDHTNNWKISDNPIATTTTDIHGNYRFYGSTDGVNTPLINPLNKYFVKFVYNGQIYEQTAYDVSGGLYDDSVSKAVEENRNEFNEKFKQINSDGNNYGNGKRAFGLNHKLEDANGNYISFTSEPGRYWENTSEDGVLMFKNAWYYFIDSNINPTDWSGEVTTANALDLWQNNERTYDYTKLRIWLANKGVSATQINQIVTYIQDCMIVATVPNGNWGLEKAYFPVENKFVLYDMSKADLKISELYEGIDIKEYAKMAALEISGDTEETKSNDEGLTNEVIKIGKYPPGSGGTRTKPPTNETTTKPGNTTPGSEGSEEIVTPAEPQPTPVANPEYGDGVGTGNVPVDNPDPKFPEPQKTLKKDATEGTETPGETTITKTPWVIIVEWIWTVVNKIFIQVNLTPTITNPTPAAGESYVNLYNATFDMRKIWDFGVYERATSQVTLTKDVYKATLVVNGKKEVYKYDKKNDGYYSETVSDESDIDLDGYGNAAWRATAKAASVLTNGTEKYYRPIRKSDYLFNDEIAYASDATLQNNAKNLQAYVTYKIVVKNEGSYDVNINEVVDYYDADEYEFDGALVGDKYELTAHTSEEDNEKHYYTYMGNKKDTVQRPEDIGIFATSLTGEQETLRGDNYNYKALYIRGSDGGPLRSSTTSYTGSTTKIMPSQFIVIYLTFKVKNSDTLNKIRLDVVDNSFIASTYKLDIGKENIAEVNSYSTYYRGNPDNSSTGVCLIDYPDHHSITDGINYPTPLNNLVVAGVIDVNSNPGSLDTLDLTSDGELKYGDGTPLQNRIEDDTDKAPNIIFYIQIGEDIEREISGKAYEDAQTITTNGSPAGDGKYDAANDTLINGITVQLVELVQEVDDDGTFTGKYLGEKVWDEYKVENGDMVLNTESENQGQDYYTGKNTAKVIVGITTEESDSVFYVDPTLEGEGAYAFRGVPSGDFYVRFIYGDTIRTVLTSDENNEVNKLLNSVAGSTTGSVSDSESGTISYYGMNAKSYNGQDYKTTTYQTVLTSSSTGNVSSVGIDQSEAFEVGQSGNTIHGYDYFNDKGSHSKGQSYCQYDESDWSKNEEYIADYADWDYKEKKSIEEFSDIYTSDAISNEDYSMLYYYNQIKADETEASYSGMSDAKDVYAYRLRTNWWSQGADISESETVKNNKSTKTLLNYRAEELASFECLSTYGSLTSKGSGATASDSSGGTMTYPAEQIATQINMINNFRKNTYMVAQTGIITNNYEYYITQLKENDASSNLSQMNGYEEGNSQETYAKDYYYNKTTNVDIGLVERPKAQVKLYKEVSNIELKLADGQTLFNSNMQAKDLMYDDHNVTTNKQLNTVSKGHEVEYKHTNGITRYSQLSEVRISTNTKDTPEIIQLTMDDELMEGAVLNITYRIVAENVGELDYNSSEFYYTGNFTNMENRTHEETAKALMSKTNVLKVIDYVANDASYDVTSQNAEATWKTYTPDELIKSTIVAGNDGASYETNKFVLSASTTDSGTTAGSTDNESNTAQEKITAQTDNWNKDYINSEYAEKLLTYNTLIVTEDLREDGGLFPTLYAYDRTDGTKSSKETSLILTTSISQSGNSNDLTYNNLVEVIETTNTVGRRMRWSRAGNQEMADQSIRTTGDGSSSTSITTVEIPDGYSSAELVTPTEIDADSSQKVQIMPPTGSVEQHNTVVITAAIIAAFIIIIAGVCIIRKRIL